MTAAWLDFLFRAGLGGAAAAVLVEIAGRVAGRHVSARHWRLAWLLAAGGFLLPGHWNIPVLPAPRAMGPGAPEPPLRLPQAAPLHLPSTAAGATTDGLIFLWAAGAGLAALVIGGRTLLTIREWRRAPFTLDPRLLRVLEECRELAGLSIPVGLIVTDRAKAPAVFGCLHPRLLLPADCARDLSDDELRDIFLHELAHIRAADLACGWLVTAMQVLQWFNPAAHFVARRWHAVREEAADERALQWRGDRSAEHYAGTLFRLLATGRVGRALGVLGISESATKLKHRIAMIHQHPRRSLPAFAAALALLLLGALLVVRPVAAEPSEADQKSAAVAAMEKWLAGIDADRYAASWKNASKLFRDAVTEPQWDAALKQVRAPLGECKNRTLASAVILTEIPRPGHEPLKGEFVLAQFKTSFANLYEAVETVTFEREKDGAWRASGYFVRSGP